MARILPLKVLSPTYRIDEASIIAALKYSKSAGVDIVNMSLGSTKYSQIFQETVASLQEQNILIIAASGNQNSSCQNAPLYPAAFEFSHLVSVGATELKDPFLLASYSNFGSCVTLAAPGGGDSDGLIVPFGDSGDRTYGTLNGTSVAAPLVSGVAALVKAIHPNLNAKELKEHLITTARELSHLRTKTKTSKLLQADSAVWNSPRSAAP